MFFLTNQKTMMNICIGTAGIEKCNIDTAYRRKYRRSAEDIGHYVANKIINYINTGTTYGSVNLPEIQLPELQSAHRIMHIHENVKGI